jgi:hypothetical protein
MFCWGVYIWDGPDVCRIRTVESAVMMGHARPPLPAAVVR